MTMTLGLRSAAAAGVGAVSSSAATAAPRRSRRMVNPPGGTIPSTAAAVGRMLAVVDTAHPTRPREVVRMRRAALSVLAALVLGAAPGRADEFALRDGDTVVFLGDSITAARAYGKIIENYT